MPVARSLKHSSKLDQIILAACVLLAGLSLILPATVREPIASGLRGTLLAPMIVLQERAELSRRAFLLHEERMATRDSVTMRALGVASLQTENQRLREIIGLGKRLEWGFVPAEALHGRGVRDAYSVILSAGSNAGVRRLSPVVAPEGLVGMVERVDPTMSQAILWTHPDFRVSAMSEDGSTFGIVQAHLGGGPSRYLLELRGVPFRTALKPGTMIVSAGLGGTYPRGIPIGVVLSELRTSEAWARTYVLRPMVAPPDINSVMILRPDRVVAGIESVWQQGGASEATIRAIIAAGDSLARSAALQEAAARRAAIQAMRADSIRGGTLQPQVLVPPPVTQPRPRSDSMTAPPPPRSDTVIRLGPPADTSRRRDSIPTPPRDRDR